MVETKTNALAAVKEIVGRYDIGEPVYLERNDRGYVNTSYIVETVLKGERKRYFLRRYKPGIKKEELDFEHAVVNHLAAMKFDLVAKVLKTREGCTCVQRFSGEDAPEGAFYSIFEFLPGEDKYTWVAPICNDEELKSAAAVLARYHQSIYRFQPPGRRSELAILELLPLIARNVASCPARTRHTVFGAYLLTNQDLILRHVERTLAVLSQRECRDAVHLVIHCDYHPGNLKFQDNQVVGLFDFDWSKIDLRCFDVGLAIMYFFTSWEEMNDGELRLAEISSFLSVYQKTLKGLAGVGPLSPIELKYLPDMINAGNLYVLNWAIEDHDYKDVDPQEYLVFLRHSVNLLKWFDDRKNREKLERMIAEIGV